VLQEREIDASAVVIRLRWTLRARGDNRYLEAAVERGTFGGSILPPERLPHPPAPLRERARTFPSWSNTWSTASPQQDREDHPQREKQTLQRLTAYDWPRQRARAQNVIERAVVLSEARRSYR